MTPPKVSPFFKALFFVAGCLSFLLGVIGIFVPLLPTTPFILLAAWCFLRSSERFHAWLITHPKFGPMIRDWNARGAIPRAAKVFALLTIASSVAMIWWRVPNEAVRIGVTVFLAGVSTFIFTRPS